MDYIYRGLQNYCCCCPEFNESLVTINGNQFKLMRLLAESLLSFVYQIKPVSGMCTFNDAEYYTLKKIICPFGDIETVSNALKEVDNYKMFQTPYIIQCMDTQVTQEKDGSKIVYILLPYYETGSLQDVLNRNLLEGTYLTENECIRIMIDICTGLLVLHDPSTRPFNDNETLINSMSTAPYIDTERLLADTLLDNRSIKSQDNKLITYSHKNIKPSNILIASDRTAIIANLSCCSRADIDVQEQNNLSEFKQWTADKCSVEYSPPELVETNAASIISTKVDIWSLGCTLYSIMFGISPFDREEQLNGTSKRVAIHKGIFSIPKQKRYSQEFIETLTRCIVVDPNTRPSTKELLSSLKILQARNR